MKTWAEARKLIHPLPAGIRTEAVELDFLAVSAPCVACGDLAETGYRGHPFHILCTVELAIYLELVKRGAAPPLAPFGLPPGEHPVA